MKYIPIIAQVLILVALLIAAGAMMTGYMTMPRDPETRAAMYALTAIFVTILDPKTLQRKENRDARTDNTDNPVNLPAE